MKQFLILLIILCVAFSGLVSCEKAEEVNIKKTHSDQEPESDKTLGGCNEKGIQGFKKIVSAVEGRDWVEIEMWTKELKEGIGYSCVELYMAEHRGISSEFVVLGSRFYDAIRTLILSCKEHDTEAIDGEFNRVLKTCDDCHDIYKDMEEDLPLGFLDK